MQGKYVAKQGCAPPKVALERVRHWKTEVIIGSLDSLVEDRYWRPSDAPADAQTGARPCPQVSGRTVRSILVRSGRFFALAELPQDVDDEPPLAEFRDVEVVHVGV